MSWTRSAFEKTNRQRSEGEGKKVVGLRSGGGGEPLRGAVGTINVRRGCCWRARQRVREVRCSSSQLIMPALDLSFINVG